jgi:hypothetical protein
MRRYLVVAHQTLGSPELRDAMRSRLDEGPCSFHVVVPQLHGGSGLGWTEGETRATAAQHLEEARLRFLADGIPVTGEVGDANPVYAISDVLISEGRDAFVEVIVSTLPLGVSRWLRMDLPTRVTRATGLPVSHVAAVHAST